MSSYALINDEASGPAAAPRSAQSSPESDSKAFTESTISELKVPRCFLETLESIAVLVEDASPRDEPWVLIRP